jgi:hypothetical protein
MGVWGLANLLVEETCSLFLWFDFPAPLTASSFLTSPPVRLEHLRIPRLESVAVDIRGIELRQQRSGTYRP